MKMFIVLAALVAAACAAPQLAQRQNEPVIVKETPLDNLGLGDYHYGFELSNGHAQQEQGTLQNAGTDNEALVVSGSFQWVDQATGQTYLVRYTADADGFHPQGDHIPSV